MRSLRAVEDYHVDRRQVEGRRRPSRAVLIARASSFAVFLFFPLQSLTRHTPGYGGPSPGGKTKVAMAAGSHLFPSRTEKLSPLAPMVLPKGGRVYSPPRGVLPCAMSPAGSMPAHWDVPGLSRAASRSRRACPVILQGAFLRIIVMNYLIISGL